MFLILSIDTLASSRNRHRDQIPVPIATNCPLHMKLGHSYLMASKQSNTFKITWHMTLESIVEICNTRRDIIWIIAYLDSRPIVVETPTKCMRDNFSSCTGIYDTSAMTENGTIHTVHPGQIRLTSTSAVRHSNPTTSLTELKINAPKELPN
jgi:hypothetical protein